MATKPSIPKGTRDFSPQEMLRRQYIFDTIRGVFRRYGFLPLETPAMENLETLTGKYGEEGDRLIFKILNSGDAWGGVSEDVKKRLAQGEEVHPGKLAAELSEKALRYDLTVPFARYVVQHQHELTFPFKRYQMQPVWRADRPQKGRYREFWQCDADVIGSDSLLNEVELVLLIKDVFESFGLKVRILINNRKQLLGLSQLFNVEERFIDFITILDKYDKIGREGVLKAYEDAGFDENLIMEMNNFMTEGENGNPSEALFKRFNANSIGIGLRGMAEILEVFKRLPESLHSGVDSSEMVTVMSDMSLARGLDYYTGAIFEVKALEGSLQSSICGGGRYDDLTGIFGLKGMSGVGISFGADRIYDVLLETGKFPAELGGSTKLLFANFGEVEAMHCLKLLRTVREAGIAAELYPDAVKMAKQFKYADAKGIPFVAIIGEQELKDGTITVKDMKSGEQRSIQETEILSAIT